MIRGFLFDLDGVIVDTAKYHYDAWRKLANQLGFDITEAQNENLKGVSRVESLEYILKLGNKKISATKKTKLAELKNKWYVDFISHLDASEVLAGVESLLRDIKAQGYLLALGSASKNSIPVLQSTGLLDLFDAIIDGNKTTQSKPHPEVFLMGAYELGLSPSECIVIEDSINGIKAAKLAGCYAIGIGDPLVLVEADVVLPDLESSSAQSLINRVLATQLEIR